MRTSCASLSWARPAIRRACSSGVRVSSSPLRVVVSVAAVEAVLRDRACDGGRNAPVQRLAARDPLAHLGGRDGRRSQLEREDAVAVSVKDGWRASRARANGDADVAQNLIRLLPGREGNGRATA